MICANENCGRDFTPVRSDQKYCRKQCGTNARNRERRAEKAKQMLRDQFNRSPGNPQSL